MGGYPCLSFISATVKISLKKPNEDIGDLTFIGRELQDRNDETRSSKD